MDDIVRQAMAKWPNVPACYGWLALDARGVWRMRDAHAQAIGSPGDPIRHPALISFIARNYLRDAAGRWYFQNGPQQVFVDLELAPFVARLQPDNAVLLHTGQPMDLPAHAWMTEDGQLLLESALGVAAVDDRDLATCIDRLELHGVANADADPDTALLNWLSAETGTPAHDGAATAPASVTLALAGRVLPVHRLRRADLPARFGFVPRPRTAEG